MILRRGKIKGGPHDVIDPSAAHAAQMVVYGRIGIKAGITAGVFKFLDQTYPSQQVKVAVNRAQTHLRQSPPNAFVELDRGRMRSHRLQFLENDLSLPRSAAMALMEAVRRGSRNPKSTINRGAGASGLSVVIVHNKNYY